MNITANATECLHAESFAEMGAIMCKVFRQAICRNAWLSFPCNIPGEFTLLQMQMNFCMQIFLQKWELYLSRFLSRLFAGTLGFLFHAIYLENLHYCKCK